MRTTAAADHLWFHEDFHDLYGAYRLTFAPGLTPGECPRPLGDLPDLAERLTGIRLTPALLGGSSYLCGTVAAS